MHCSESIGGSEPLKKLVLRSKIAIVSNRTLAKSRAWEHRSNLVLG